MTLRAGKAMGINPEIVDVSIPLLVNLNKGGVAMIAALKIVFIYSVLGMEFTTETFFLTMLIAVLSAIIVGGVPGGRSLARSLSSPRWVCRWKRSRCWWYWAPLPMRQLH